jgi:hypothetical protein
MNYEMASNLKLLSLTCMFLLLTYCRQVDQPPHCLTRNTQLLRKGTVPICYQISVTFTGSSCMHACDYDIVSPSPSLRPPLFPRLAHGRASEVFPGSLPHTTTNKKVNINAIIMLYSNVTACIHMINIA